VSKYLLFNDFMPFELFREIYKSNKNNMAIKIPTKAPGGSRKSSLSAYVCILVIYHDER
jgi:hypothetical protein